jgi:uncharacterized protein YodC (DUF2158 family)
MPNANDQELVSRTLTEMLKYGEGDAVQLKSGGTKMTVESVSDDGVTCVWFTLTGTLKRDKLKASILEKADSSRMVVIMPDLEFRDTEEGESSE